MRDLYSNEIEELKALYPIIKECKGSRLLIKVFPEIKNEYDYVVNVREYDVDMRQLIVHLNDLMLYTRPQRLDMSGHEQWQALHILTNILMEL
jgi:hypothetical protein